jgi:tetratricopeptide (TPR) repeat protein
MLLPPKRFPAMVPILLTLALFSAFGVATAQQPLDVARYRMQIGRTGDARKIVAGELASGSELARLMNAVLTAPADSAAVLLEKFARESGRGQNTGQAAERMGDLLFSAERWGNAVEWWDFALKNISGKTDYQRLRIKTARAELKRGRTKQALSRLESALADGESSLTGEVKFWQGAALESQGKTRNAAEAYLTAYTATDNRLSLAALHRLHNFYGSSGGSNAQDWRTRWQNASAGTVFESRYLPAATAASSGWTVQLGAFSSSARATDHATRIRRLGLNPVIGQPRGDKLYRVRIESIPSQKELKRVTTLLKKNKLDYHVIKPGN